MTQGCLYIYLFILMVVFFSIKKFSVKKDKVSTLFWRYKNWWYNLKFSIYKKCIEQTLYVTMFISLFLIGVLFLYFLWIAAAFWALYHSYNHFTIAEKVLHKKTL